MQQSAYREYRADAFLLVLMTLIGVASRFLPRTAFAAETLGVDPEGMLAHYLPALVPTFSLLVAAGFFVYFLATCKRRRAHDFVISLLLALSSLSATACFWHFTLLPGAADFVYDADAFLIVVYAASTAAENVEGMFFDPQFFCFLFCFLYLFATMLYAPVKRELRENA